jgi:hypothetical protein
LEVDEHQHKTDKYTEEGDWSRMRAVSRQLGGRCLWVRFNPDAYSPSDGATVRSCWRTGVRTELHPHCVKEWESRMSKLADVLRDALEYDEYASRAQENKFVVKYLFYDHSKPREVIGEF